MTVSMDTRAAGPPVAGSRGRHDPRLYQIATLAGLLTYGLACLDFDLPATHGLTILATVLAAQYVGTRLSGPARFDPRSALISGLSLCLLLRTNSLRVAALAAAIAIASKFFLRFRGKHLFNPTNFALVAMLLVSSEAWVSPGQWGSGAVFAFAMASAGALVVNRAARGDVTWAFLACYAAIVVGRSLWLGEPFSISWHRLESGALVLFAFFMISDPRTTPDSRGGRLLFAGLVAAGAGLVQFGLHRPNGLLWSLAVVSLVVPLLDRLLPGARYIWGQPAAGPPHPGGVHDEADHDRHRDATEHGPVCPGRPGLLRLLRGEGRYRAVQPRLPGSSGSARRPDGSHHGERLSR